MDDEDGYVGERVAAAYDESSADMFEPGDVAAHLEPGGCFVIEVGMPDLRRMPAGQNVVPFHVSPTRWAFDVHDVATQAMSSNYVEVVDGHGEYRSIPFRYVWLPLFADQPYNAARVAALGAGTTVADGTAAAGRIGAAVGTVLGDPAYRASAQRIAAEIGALPTADRTADMLAELVTPRPA